MSNQRWAAKRRNQPPAHVKKRIIDMSNDMPAADASSDEWQAWVKRANADGKTEPTPQQKQRIVNARRARALGIDPERWLEKRGINAEPTPQQQRAAIEIRRARGKLKRLGIYTNDTDAIASDWDTIGQDLHDAINVVDAELRKAMAIPPHTMVDGYSRVTSADMTVEWGGSGAFLIDDPEGDRLRQKDKDEWDATYPVVNVQLGSRPRQSHRKGSRLARMRQVLASALKRPAKAQDVKEPTSARSSDTFEKNDKSPPSGDIRNDKSI